MTDLLIHIQTLRKRLFEIFPLASIIDIAIGGQSLVLRVYWEHRTKGACKVEHRIPWSLLADHRQPWLVMEDAITRLRAAYNS